MSTPIRNLKDFGRNDIADHSSTDQRSVVTTNADTKHNSAVNTPQCQPDLNASVDLDSTATTTAHGRGLNIASTTSSSFSDNLQKESATLPPHGSRYSEAPGQTQITDEVLDTPIESHVPCESEAFNEPQDPVVQVKLEPESTIRPEPAASAQPSRIQPLDSPPPVIKVEPESPIQNEYQTHMEPDSCSQRFYSPVHRTDTGLQSPEDDHIKFVYPTLDRNVLSPTTGTERASHNQLAHPAHSQMDLSSRNQLEHPPLDLPSFSQLASSTFMPARVGFTPLGLLPRPPLINPKPGLFAHLQPNLVSRSNPGLVPKFGIPFSSQSELNASSHNEQHVQKVLEPVSCTEPSQTHGPQALSQANVKPALRGSPQPVTHSGYEPPAEPDPAAHSEPDQASHSEPDQASHSEPDQAAHSEPSPSAVHTTDAEVDSMMSGLFSSGGLNVFGAATPTPSRNPFELPTPAKSRKKKVSSGRAASLLMDMDFSIPGNTTLTEPVEQVAEACLDLADGVSTESPSKKNVEIGVDKIYANLLLVILMLSLLPKRLPVILLPKALPSNRSLEFLLKNLCTTLANHLVKHPL
ncbi:uncharacterized protein EV154DRAFT_193413 [Mucor mucedo]|uniref:uncharacterized protein n=1 Tax=Mucor mucedo TaxID=29922 RepID=UPI00221E6E87|nr:uncharacterized protein EV154DRAFT_193413 [Mucor mucedo]KAI7892416.1 hypothetical protein EV154DRAFT_193413 [Mucor mucedo]